MLRCKNGSNIIVFRNLSTNEISFHVLIQCILHIAILFYKASPSNYLAIFGTNFPNINSYFFQDKEYPIQFAANKNENIVLCKQFIDAITKSLCVC